MSLNPNDIVTIQFPFSDFSSAKRRPVVLISPFDRFGDFTCLAITILDAERR